MASIKISGLPEQTAVAGTDVLPIDSGDGEAKTISAAGLGEWMMDNVVKESIDPKNVKLVVCKGDHEYLQKNVDSTILKAPTTANYIYFAAVSGGVVIGALAIGIDYTRKCYAYANTATSNSWVVLN